METIDKDELDRRIAKHIEAECSHDDIEAAHLNADAILTDLLEQLGFNKTVAAWSEVDKWYS